MRVQLQDVSGVVEPANPNLELERIRIKTTSEQGAAMGRMPRLPWITR